MRLDRVSSSLPARARVGAHQGLATLQQLLDLATQFVLRASDLLRFFQQLLRVERAVLLLDQLGDSFGVSAECLDQRIETRVSVVAHAKQRLSGPRESGDFALEVGDQSPRDRDARSLIGQHDLRRDVVGANTGQPIEHESFTMLEFGERLSPAADLPIQVFDTRRPPLRGTTFFGLFGDPGELVVSATSLVGSQLCVDGVELRTQIARSLRGALAGHLQAFPVAA